MSNCYYTSSYYICTCGYQIQNNDKKLIMMKRKLHMKKCKEDFNDGKNLIQMPTYNAKFGTTENNVNVRTIKFNNDLEITDKVILTTGNNMTMNIDKSERRMCVFTAEDLKTMPIEESEFYKYCMNIKMK